MRTGIEPDRKELALAIKQATWDRFHSAYRKKFRKEVEAGTFVVLASVSLVQAETQKHWVAAVGEGTKSLPSCAVQEGSRRDLLEDMHAEMLALRGFRRFLLKELASGSSSFLEWSSKKGKHALRGGFEVWLYCSEVFCGDCCISQQQESFSGAKPLAFLKEQTYPDQKFRQDVLRTKPGRIDLPLGKRSAILSCSDLIGICNILGIQGKALFSSLTPIYLSTIIVDSPSHLRESLLKGTSLPLRLARLLNRSPALIQRQILNIVVEGKERIISSQFGHRTPEVVVLEKEERRDREGFELCGIFTEELEEWTNGRSGLPEGSSLKNYRQKGRISKFSEASLTKQFQFYRENQLSFKYEAVLDRIKRLFGQWIQGAGE